MNTATPQPSAIRWVERHPGLDPVVWMACNHQKKSHRRVCPTMDGEPSGATITACADCAGYNDGSGWYPADAWHPKGAGTALAASLRRAPKPGEQRPVDAAGLAREVAAALDVAVRDLGALRALAHPAWQSVLDADLADLMLAASRLSTLEEWVALSRASDHTEQGAAG